MQGLPADWEKLFVDNVTYKGLIFKIYKQFIQSITKKQTQSKNKWKTQIDISPKKIYRWPNGTWKDNQHH